MKIETKFKVGDKIYCINYFKGVVERTIIRIIITSITSKVYYDVCFIENCEELYEEKDCFTTKEEAIKECDRRNGK